MVTTRAVLFPLILTLKQAHEKEENSPQVEFSVVIMDTMVHTRILVNTENKQQQQTHESISMGRADSCRFRGPGPLRFIFALGYGSKLVTEILFRASLEVARVGLKIICVMYLP